MRILVVDDDDALRKGLAFLLRLSGHEVSSAAHGAEALSMLQAEPLPDIILLDLSMPVMDGATFRRAQLADDRLRGIRTLVLTGESRLPSGLALDAPVLRKPVSSRQILNAIAALPLSSRRA